jgi:hypothetical protein
MPLNVKNLAWLKGLVVPGIQDFGVKMGELVQSVVQGTNNIEQQTNSNATGDPPPPPPINSLNVTAANGHFQLSIDHSGAQIYRGVNYFAEHSATAGFSDPHIIDMGTSRNYNLFLGNATRYFRAYAAYPGSGPNQMVYHGSQVAPLAVTGGGSIPGPTFAASQGSGTGAAGQPHSGFGPVPYRTSTGAPPIRS